MPAFDKIFAPVFVGRPPENAFNGLVQLPNGEIRHYGFEGPWSNPGPYVYVYSRDHGLTWKKHIIEDSIQFTNENMPAPAVSPYSGDLIRLISTGNGTWVLRSKTGIDGKYSKHLIDTGNFEMVRPPFFLKRRRRVLVTCQQTKMVGEKEIIQSCVFSSDDDGYTWKKSWVPIGPTFTVEWPHAKSRWQNYAVEPTIAELADGTLWMLCRTSMDRLYESFSKNSGSTWSAPEPSRFFATLTMPTFLRMRDGRLLLFECNTTPLPEVDRSDDSTLTTAQKTGSTWEDVFTNRDVIHAAVSEDDGKTWIGFRELYMNPLRNDSDFATSGGKELSLDKSVQQSQAIELPEGKVLVSLGQHPLVRAMIIFDPDWLYEKSRRDDFTHGLVNWSTFKYVNGIHGHCAYNRQPGARLITGLEGSNVKYLQICRPQNANLVCENDGAVWNFPAMHKGRFSTRIFLKPGGLGGTISLADRWFNPTDTLAHYFAMYSLSFDGKGNNNHSGQHILDTGRWNDILLEWENLQSGTCRLIINGKISKDLRLQWPSINGISYVHFQSKTTEIDNEGFLIQSVEAHQIK